MKSKLYGVKFHVPSKGLENDNTWRIYEELNKGFTNTHYIDSVRIIGTDSWTGEQLYQVGYSLITEGYLDFFKDPDTGKRMAVIHSGNVEIDFEPWES